MAKAKGTDFLKVISGTIQSKTYSFAIFTIAVVIILLVGAIRPTVLTITKISSDIKEKELINERLNTKINNLSVLSNEYDRLREDFETLPLIFPTQGNFSLFMSNVEQISKDNGYTLNNVSFNTPQEMDLRLTVLKPWAARITVAGSKANLVRLLEAFESMPMYPIVNKVSFANTPDENNQTVISIEMIIFRIDDPNFYD